MRRSLRMIMITMDTIMTTRIAGTIIHMIMIIRTATHMATATTRPAVIYSGILACRTDSPA